MTARRILHGLLQRAHHWLLHSTADHWPGVDLSLAGGIELHLVGSVHMGTPDMAPLPGALLEKLASASALIVEADIVNGASPLPDMAPRPPLAQRLDNALYQQVTQRAAQLAIPLNALTDKPLWQVALILQLTQAQQLGFCNEYGIDYQLLQAAHGKQTPIIELEGAARHLQLLSQLAADGENLLRDVLRHWHSNARLLQLMASWWTGSPPVFRRDALPGIFSHELHDALLRQRNQQWSEYLPALPAGNYLVVVGALHLYGTDNLPALLKSRL